MRRPASRSPSRRCRSSNRSSSSSAMCSTTTAVRILTTIIRPDAGHASVLGHDVVREPDTVRSLIGLAGQYAAVDENLTGRENLRLVGKLTHLAPSHVRERADELLEIFGL